MLLCSSDVAHMRRVYHMTVNLSPVTAVDDVIHEVVLYSHCVLVLL